MNAGRAAVLALAIGAPLLILRVPAVPRRPSAHLTLAATSAMASGSGRLLFLSSFADDVLRPTGDVGDAPELAGIVGRLPDAVALLRLADGSTRGFRRGETADGWRVVAIAGDRARLARGETVHLAVLPPSG